jgi:hypothetical protein
MRDDVIHRIGYQCLASVKSVPNFPYKTGNLRNNATMIEFPIRNQFMIIFDKRVAPYIDKLKTHKKHRTFFAETATNTVVRTIRSQFHNTSRYMVVSSLGKGFISK